MQSITAIPEEWRGPACAAFDLEMSKVSGQSYHRASELASLLAHFEEMSFEPSPRERAILEERAQYIDDARCWLRENVLCNPVIKRLMYETVRDLGRDTGDPVADAARHEYLREMGGEG